jgi:hypothetical protein
MTDFVQFLKAHLYASDGNSVPTADVYDRFLKWLPARERPSWSRRSLCAALRAQGLVLGRSTRTARLSIANFSLRPLAPRAYRLELDGEYLRPERHKTPKRDLRERLKEVGRVL